MNNSQFEVTMPLVSIIIPTYNGEKFIKKAVDSVLNQSFQDFEIIISDDASNDNIEEVIQEYTNDPKVSFFQNYKQLGIGGNWNYGIEKSNGKYIKILCQDDILKPHYLYEVVEVLEKDPSISLVTTFEQFFGDSDRVRDENEIPFSNKVPGAEVQNSVLKKGNWIGGPTAVTFRQTDLTVGMFDTSFKCGLDYEMWLRLLGEGNLYVVPKILFQSRIHEGQATAGCKRNLDFDKDSIRILNKMKAFPQKYGGIDSENVQGSLKRSIQIFVHKSFKNKKIKNTSAWFFLYQNIGFSKSLTSLVRGCVLLSLQSFRRVLKR